MWVEVESIGGNGLPFLFNTDKLLAMIPYRGKTNEKNIRFRLALVASPEQTEMPDMAPAISFIGDDELSITLHRIAVALANGDSYYIIPAAVLRDETEDDQ